MKPSRAGSKVREESIVSVTVMAAVTATPYRNVTPSANWPSSAMQTIRPANSTARPAVLTALAAASSTLRPPRSPVRCRVTMNSA